MDTSFQYPDPPQPPNLYPLHELPEPPEDYTFYGTELASITKGRRYSRASLEALMKFHFWGISYGTVDRMTNEVRLKLLRKLNYYQSDSHRPPTLHEFLNTRRDAGPRLLRIDLPTPPDPVSRWYPALPPRSPEHLSVGRDGEVNTIPQSYHAQFSYSSAPVASVDVNGPLNATTFSNTNQPIEQFRGLTNITSGAAGHSGIAQLAGALIPSPPAVPARQQRQNLPAFTEASQTTKHPPPQRAQAGPSRQNPSASIDLVIVDGSENDNSQPRMDLETSDNMPSDQPQDSDETLPAESPRRANAARSCSNKAIVEAVEKAIMQFAYRDLDRHPLAHPKTVRPYLTAIQERDLLKAITESFSGTAYARLSGKHEFAFDPRGYNYSYRGRGPVWNNNSCAIDCAIVAGKFLDAGSTIIDRGDDPIAWEEQLTELEKAFLDSLDINWDVLPAKTSSDQRDRFWQVIVRHMRGTEIGRSMAVTALWMEATRSFGQFKFSYTEEKTSCSCKGKRTQSSFITASAVTPSFIQADQAGVSMETLLRRFFRHETLTDCRYCKGKGTGVCRKVFHNLPMRMVVELHNDASPMNHTSNDISFAYHDETGREQVATYRWLGGIYSAKYGTYMEGNAKKDVYHFRVYWTDAERGEADNGEIRMYDGMQNLGLIVGNIPAFHRDDRVPEQWWKDHSIPLLFYERVLNPDANVLDIAHQTVQNMINIQKGNQLILKEHTPWSLQNPPANGPRPLSVLTDGQSRRRRRFNTVSLTPDGAEEDLHGANPVTERVRQRPAQASQSSTSAITSATIGSHDSQPSPVRLKFRQRTSQSSTSTGLPTTIGNDNSQHYASTSCYHTGMQMYAPTGSSRFTASQSFSVQPKQMTRASPAIDPRLLAYSEQQAIVMAHNVQQRPQPQKGTQMGSFSGFQDQRQSPRRNNRAGPKRVKQAKTPPLQIVTPTGTQASHTPQGNQPQSFPEAEVPQQPFSTQQDVPGAESSHETSQTEQTASQPQFLDHEQTLQPLESVPAPQDIPDLVSALETPQAAQTITQPQIFQEGQGLQEQQGGYEFVSAQETSQTGHEVTRSQFYEEEQVLQFLRPAVAQEEEAPSLENAPDVTAAALQAVTQEIENFGRRLSQQGNLTEGGDDQQTGDLGQCAFFNDLPDIGPDLGDMDWLLQWEAPQPETIQQQSQPDASQQPQELQEQQEQQEMKAEEEQSPLSRKDQGKKRARDETEYEKDDDLSPEHPEKKQRLDTSTDEHTEPTLPTTSQEEDQGESISKLQGKKKA